MNIPEVMNRVTITGSIDIGRAPRQWGSVWPKIINFRGKIPVSF